MKKILLVLLFAFSLFAGESEEIGVPYFDRDQGLIDSAVLSSDAKSFYTLKDNYFIHWSLSPLKKLQQWELSLAPLEPMKKVKNHRDVYLLNDETKVLIISRDELILYDLKTKSIEKKIACPNHSHVLEGDLLYVARADGLEVKIVDYPHLYVEIWNIHALKKIKSVDISKQSDHFKYHLIKTYTEDGDLFTPNDSRMYAGTLLSGKDIIYYVASTNRIGIIDKTSLTLKDVIKNRITEVSSDGYIHMNPAVSSLVKVESDNINLIVNGLDDSIVMTSTFEPSIEFKAIIDSPKRLPWRTIRRFYPSGQRMISKKGDLLLFYQSSSVPYVFYRKYEDKPFVLLYQYKDELVMKQVKPYAFETSLKKFQLLNMINKDGIMPMNKATFEKYNQPLNIKAN